MGWAAEMGPYLSVVVPAYNEEKRIGQTLKAMRAYLEQQSFSWEIIVVLDGCQDGTLDVVEAFGRSDERVKWINRRENRGKGYTIREGMLAAQGEIRLFSDADNSTDMAHFDLMAPYIAKGSEVVICSRDRRDVSGARQAVPQSFLKRLMGDGGNLLIQLLAVPGIWDTQCGFKAFSAALAERIFRVAQIERYGIDVEALALARHFHHDIAIVPANWIDAEGTHVTRWDYLRTLWETAKVRWHIFSGLYDRLDACEDSGTSP